MSKFAVVDVETSGLSLDTHHIIQVGVVTVDGVAILVARSSSGW